MDEKYIFVGEVAEYLVRKSLAAKDHTPESLIDSLTAYELCHLRDLKGLEGVVNLSNRASTESDEIDGRLGGRISIGREYEYTENRLHTGTVIPATTIESQNRAAEKGATLGDFVDTPLLGKRQVRKVMTGIAGFETTYLLEEQFNLPTLQSILADFQ